MIQVEPAGWRDLNAVRSLEKVCFPKDAWSILDLVGVLTLPNVVRLKAVEADEMVGFVAGDIKREENTGWIATIGVLPAYRGRGIAAMLMQACEQQMAMPRVRLSVRASNLSAIRLYQKLGYTHTGLWPDYYSDGEDALILQKTLPQAQLLMR